MEAIALGSLAEKFHAVQQTSTMASQLSKATMARVLARR
jgi:hypothetical protein